MKWYGVMPAMTTCFDQKLRVDHAFMTRHVQWLLANGCTGIVALGSLGEAATLTFDEKVAILRNVVAAAKPAPIVAAISALSTEEAVALAKAAEQAGCAGLMVLPPYVYQGDWAEMKAHIAAIMRATPLSCMLYNNPVSYGTDFLPEQIAELTAEHPNFAAVKESSTDVRRVTAIRALTGDRLQIFVGVDDAIVEGIAAGAVGWIAGLVSAYPAESVQLFNLAMDGKAAEAFALYRWFLPLLRMDTVPKFVQLIKQVQQEVGVGSARVRPPRLEVTGAELEAVRSAVKQAHAHPPSVRSTAFPG
ncbi:MAG TPA: dihydrodipicolinate synthase family protein [Acidobacteriaceae bacterium]|nr:dihydrodipicolinate synthase family protein [Acidobacteriaceae bacterium]